MARRRHLVAVNRSIRAAALDETGIDAALVELLRDFARQMDSAGVDGPPARLVSAYLSAQKDLVRAITRNSVRKRPQAAASSAPAAPAQALRIVEETTLEKLRKKKRQAS